MEFDQVTWYGKGPDENYIDRQTGYDVGVYQSTVSDFFVDYIKPQETGNRIGTRWVSLTNADGIGLLAKAEDTIEFNALYYSPEDLSNALHSYQLESPQNITLRLNQRQMGLGGDQSWGAMPFEQYQIPANQTYAYSYTLKPVSGDDVDALMAESKKVLPAPAIDWSDLEDAVEKAQKIDPELYTEQSVLAFSDALQKALDALDDKSLKQDEIDAAEAALLKAIDDLVPLVQPDKRLLVRTIEYAKEQMEKDDYQYVVEDVRINFEKALAAAIAVDENPKATREEILEAWTTLVKWIHGLGLQTGDKTLLLEAITEAGSYNLDNYVEQGKQAFRNALKTAQEVYERDFVSQDEINSATDALLDAILELRLKANKSNLDALLKQADNLDLSQYTDASAAVLMLAIQEGRSLMEQDLSVEDQPKIDRAEQRIQRAMDDLEPKEDNPSGPSGDASDDTPSKDDPSVSTPSKDESGSGSTAGTSSKHSSSSKTSSSGGKNNVFTGDTMPIMLLLALAFVSSATVVCSKRKKTK